MNYARSPNDAGASLRIWRRTICSPAWRWECKIHPAARGSFVKKEKNQIHEALKSHSFIPQSQAKEKRHEIVKRLQEKSCLAQILISLLPRSATSSVFLMPPASIRRSIDQIKLRGQSIDGVPNSLDDAICHDAMALTESSLDSSQPVRLKIFQEETHDNTARQTSFICSAICAGWNICSFPIRKLQYSPAARACRAEKNRRIAHSLIIFAAKSRRCVRAA
jgi:hypothetical protein